MAYYLMAHVKEIDIDEPHQTQNFIEVQKHYVMVKDFMRIELYALMQDYHPEIIEGDMFMIEGAYQAKVNPLIHKVKT